MTAEGDGLTRLGRLILTGDECGEAVVLSSDEKEAVLTSQCEGRCMEFVTVTVGGKCVLIENRGCRDDPLWCKRKSAINRAKVEGLEVRLGF